MLSAYYYCFYVARLRSPMMIRHVTLSDQSIDLQDQQGNHIRARLSGESFVSKFLIILVFYPESKYKRKSILIFPDSIGRQTFNQLKKVLLHV